MAALDLDADGFLTSLGILEQRFDEMTLRRLPYITTRDRYRLIGDLRNMTDDLFGATVWAVAIYMASVPMAIPMSIVTELVGECRRFLEVSASVVRRRGMAVWLYGLLSDAARTALVGCASERMPVCISTASRDAMMIRWFAGDQDSGVNRCSGCDRKPDAERDSGADRNSFFDRDLVFDWNASADRCSVVCRSVPCVASRVEMEGVPENAERSSEYQDDIIEHAMHMYRLAAYSLLRWGSREPRSLEIAQMLITHPGLGVGMLREDDGVLALGMNPNMQHCRAVDYLKGLRVQSDLQYARALASGSAPLPSEGQPAGFAEVDARYLYDARRLVPAYRALWNDKTMCGADVLDHIERGGETAKVPLWRNTAYLDDLAQSLMGAFFAADLVVGFANRDMDRFTEGVEQLEQFAACVESAGFAALPGVVLSTYAVDADGDAGAVTDTDIDSDTDSDTDLDTDSDADTGAGSDSDGGVNAKANANAKVKASANAKASALADDSIADAASTLENRYSARRTLSRVGDSMAAVALARMPTDDLARRSALLMIACDCDRYRALIMDASRLM